MKNVLKIGLLCGIVWALVNAIGGWFLRRSCRKELFGDDVSLCGSGEKCCPVKKVAGKLQSLLHRPADCQ